MKAEIRDPVVLAAVLPPGVEAYLRSAGWQPEHRDRVAAVWSYPAEPEAHEILVPLDPTASGYVQRVSELLGGLEAAEHRSQLHIFQDLQSSDCDVIRLAAAAGPAAEVPTFASALALGEHGRDLLAAIAGATVEPQPWFNKRRPKAQDYLACLEVGSFGEPGSICVMARLDTTLFPDSEDEFVPFPRRVSLTLRSAMNQLHRLLAGQDLAVKSDWLTASLQQGLSANVCESLAKLLTPDGAGIAAVALSLRLAAARPFSGHSLSQWRFPRSTLPTLLELSERLKSFAMRSDDAILFLISDIRKARQGATVRGIALVDDEAAPISIPIDDDLVPLLERALQRKEAVRCKGRLRPRPGSRGFEILRPNEFEVLHDDGGDPGVRVLRKGIGRVERPTFWEKSGTGE